MTKRDAMSMKKKVYLAVSPDKYELPLAIADSAIHLAEMMGITTNTIYPAIARGCCSNTPKGKVKFISVIIDLEED